MRQIISIGMRMAFAPAFPALGACASFRAFRGAPTDGRARLRVRRAHSGRRIARAWSRACSTFAARSIGLLSEVLLGVLNMLIGAISGARFPPPGFFRVRVRRLCAACALTAVCARLCRRMAALARWLGHQHPGHRCRASNHRDWRQVRLPLRGPRAPVGAVRGTAARRPRTSRSALIVAPPAAPRGSDRAPA